MSASSLMRPCSPTIGPTLLWRAPSWCPRGFYSGPTVVPRHSHCGPNAVPSRSHRIPTRTSHCGPIAVPLRPLGVSRSHGGPAAVPRLRAQAGRRFEAEVDHRAKAAAASVEAVRLLDALVTPGSGSPLVGGASTTARALTGPLWSFLALFLALFGSFRRKLAFPGPCWPFLALPNGPDWRGLAVVGPVRP